MANHMKDKMSPETTQKMMQHYSTIAQEAMKMLQSKDSADREQALEKLHDIKNQLMDTIYALADQVGLPKDRIEKMVTDPASLLTPETLESFKALQSVGKQ